MNQTDTANLVKNAVGVAGGAALIAPVAPIAPPLLHGLAGIAVVGLGVFAVGSLALKVVETIAGADNPFKPKESTKTRQPEKIQFYSHK